MLVPDPADHARREGLAGGACLPKSIEFRRHLVVIVIVGEACDIGDEFGPVAHCIGAVRRQRNFDRLGRAALPANLHFELLWLRPFLDVMSLINNRSMRLRSRAAVVGAVHNRGKSLANSRICRFWSVVIARSVWRSKLASSASRSITRCIASFQRCSRVLAISRLAGSTAS